MADGGTYGLEQRHTPLHNLAAEMAVIGAVLYENTAYDHVDYLSSEDFYAPANGKIWMACRDLIIAGKVADGITLQEWFKSSDVFKDIGGHTYLTRLLDSAAFGPEIRDYALLIHRLSSRRRIKAAAAQMSELAVSSDSADLSVEDLLSQANNVLGKIDSGSISNDWSISSDDVQKLFADMSAGVTEDIITTGLDPLDRQICGMAGGDLVILDGRPSMGKTALCTHLAFNIARQLVPEGEDGGIEWKGAKRRVVAFFSLEMTKKQLAMRAASSWVFENTKQVIPYKRMRQNAVSSEEMTTAIEAVRDLPKIVWNERSAVSIDYVRSEIRRLKRKYGRIDAIFCDYLQIMGRDKRVPTVEALGQISSGFKGLAKEYSCPAVLLAQVKRDVEDRDDKRPRNSDIKGSGDIEQDADIILHMFREFEYLKDAPRPKSATEENEFEDQLEALRNQIEVGVGKCRMGEQGRVILYWNPPTGFISSNRMDVS